MDTNQLFSFLDDGSENKDVVKSRRKKRKVVPTEDAQDGPAEGDLAMHSDPPLEASSTNDGVGGGHDSKRARLSPPLASKPVVVDEIEIEARREVPVNPGLMSAGSEVGTSLLLTHQVSRLEVLDPCDD